MPSIQLMASIFFTLEYYHCHNIRKHKLQNNSFYLIITKYFFFHILSIASTFIYTVLQLMILELFFNISIEKINQIN